MKSLIQVINENKADNEICDMAINILRNAKTSMGNIYTDESDVVALIELAKSKLTKTNTSAKCYVVICKDTKRDVEGIQFVDLNTRFNGGSGVAKHGVSFYTSKYCATYALDFMKERNNPNGIDGKMDEFEFYKFNPTLVKQLWDAYESK